MTSVRREKIEDHMAKGSPDGNAGRPDAPGAFYFKGIAEQLKNWNHADSI